MSEPTLVSVIVPTHNRPDLLRNALASIRALEGPDLRFEIIVGDNGKNPDTPVAAAEYGAIYRQTDKTGAAAARNLGLEVATGEYFSFLDDDDIYLPNHIRPHIAMLRARPAIDAVICQLFYCNERLEKQSAAHPAVGPAEGDDMLRAFLGPWFPQVGTIVARASVRETVGMFEADNIWAEDVDWTIRLARRRKLAFLEQPCLLFRGRGSATYEYLYRNRTKGGRKIFLRHALAERHIWRTRKEFWQAYRHRLQLFYTYFIERARQNASSGKRAQAIVNLLDAAYVFPFEFIGRALVRCMPKGSAKSVTQTATENAERGPQSEAAEKG